MARKIPLSQDPSRSWGEVDTLDALLRLVREKQPTGGRFLAFRGQANSAWYNLPSIYRRPNKRAANEHKLVREIIGLHPDEFRGDSTMFDRLVRMQHFGLPTRLSDVTANPLVALYFACERHIENAKYKPPGARRPLDDVFRLEPCDGKIFVYSIPEGGTKFYDSHTVSLLANLSRLTQEKKSILQNDPDSDSAESILEELSRLVSEENPGFKNEIQVNSLFERLYVTPKQANKRIVAQAGAFIIAGLRDAERTRSGMSLYHFTVPHQSKLPILNQLDALGINGRTMFPELDKAAKYLADKYGA